MHSNGGGVYTQELGNAGIGPTNFMITHFFNYGNGVYVLGRYYDSSLGDYTTGSARSRPLALTNALAGVPVGSYSIVSVSETLTNPTFVLTGGRFPAG